MLRTGFRKLDRVSNSRAVRNGTTLALVIIGPILVVATFVFFGAFDRPGDPQLLRYIILADLVYTLIIAALVFRQVVQIIVARRRRSAGSKLHLRLTGVFTLTALIPTVLVAVFAAITLNFGLEGWFSDRVRLVVNNSLTAAQAYEAEHRKNLESDAQLLANYLDAQKRRLKLLTVGDLREYLNRGQVQMQRALTEAYVIDVDGGLIARGERSYLFDYEQPSAKQIEKALGGESVIIEDWSNSEFRALIGLSAYADRLLYVTRDVDGEILLLLDDTQETVSLYNQLENDRGRLLFEFALIYLGFALIVILAAVWFGMWFAERLSRPVGRLAGAAERVGAGDLDVRVIEEDGDDEIAMLGRVFNRMTQQVKGQRDALMAVNEETEKSRRLFDSVLSGVTAGVIGLDGGGKIEFMNAAAEHMLGLESDAALGIGILQAAPEFADLFNKLSSSTRQSTQGEVELIRSGVHEDLLVRMATRRPSEGSVEGYVIAFDDVTDLVSAQRMAAWGDVARRIAHEIKNPLTPIQLSAERIRRKFGPLVGDQQEALQQYSDVIIRQTNDLRRIVDEFAKFGRMPEAKKAPSDILEILRGVVLLQNEADSDISVTLDTSEDVLKVMLDETLISQAFTNLVKNAREAVAAKQAAAGSFIGQVRVVVTSDHGVAVIQIQDNGVGFPLKRARLFEPYVTHRDSGTGLGLSIVKKIVEEHDGQLELLDAPVFDGNKHHGAEVKMTLPTINTEDQRNGS
ncbi:PAS domain-containing sensor histidine kinase [Rhodobacterales bacterium 52_120_T64]|nr:PAS domain-containing sensor histidine kinase [Rhodobacterales bacterium 52_120_T64]